MQIRMDEKGRILFMATYVISDIHGEYESCLLYTSPSPRDA